MKVVQLKQNTEEWLEFRKGKSGGSGEPRPHARFQESLWDLAPAAR